MRKTITTLILTAGIVFAGAPAMADDAPSGPAPVGNIVTNGGCYTDAELAAMDDAQLAAIGPVPDYCWGHPSVGQIVTACEGDACQAAATVAPTSPVRHHKAHRKHHRRSHR